MKYEDMSAADLRELASRREISGRSEMNKEELVQALTLADGNEVAVLRDRVEALAQEVDGLRSSVQQMQMQHPFGTPGIPTR